jgi:hypothetical protein
VGVAEKEVSGRVAIYVKTIIWGDPQNLFYKKGTKETRSKEKNARDKSNETSCS